MITVNQSASWVRMYSDLTTKGIANPPNGLDQARPAARLELLPQVPDMNLHNTGVRVGLVPPDAFEELLAGENLARVAHEEEEEVELAGGQFQGVAATPGLPGSRVHDEVGVGQRLVTAVVTAQHGANSGDQLVEGEWLGHVVIGTQVEGGHLVDNIVAGGQHDDGNVLGEPQLPAHLEPVRSWQADVEQDDVGTMPGRGRQPGGAIHRSHHLEPLERQATLQEWEDFRIVVDQQHSGRHRPRLHTRGTIRGPHWPARRESGRPVDHRLARRRAPRSAASINIPSRIVPSIASPPEGRLKLWR